MLFSRLIHFFKPASRTAAQAWQQANGSEQHAFWMFAWPVHMLLGRDSFFLTEPASVLLSIDESLSLIASLNAHFEAQALHFYLQPLGQKPDQWFLGLDADPVITTTPLQKVKNKDVAPFMPTGEGALAWASLQNEIQMLLFAHPVNVQREQAGLPVINSLWCDGLAKSGTVSVS